MEALAAIQVSSRHQSAFQPVTKPLISRQSLFKRKSRKSTPSKLDSLLDKKFPNSQVMFIMSFYESAYRVELSLSRKNAKILKYSSLKRTFPTCEKSHIIIKFLVQDMQSKLMKYLVVLLKSYNKYTCMCVSINAANVVVRFGDQHRLDINWFGSI